MTHAEGPQHGYTLVEVLVAFAILSMTLTVLYRIFASGVTNIGVSSEYLQAALIAEARLEATGLSESLVPGHLEGVELNRFKWTQEITEAPLPQADPARRAGFAIYRIRVAVEWPGGRDMRHIDLETLRVTETRESTGALR